MLDEKKLDLVSYLTKYAANLNSIDVIEEIKEGNSEDKDSDLSSDDDDMHMWEKTSKNVLLPNPIAKRNHSDSDSEHEIETFSYKKKIK